MDETTPAEPPTFQEISEISSIEEFWALVVDVWNYGVFGINFGQIAVAIGIFTLFMAFRRLFTKILISRIQKRAAKTETKFDDTLANALTDPVRFIPVVMGAFFAFEYLDLEGGIAGIADNVTRSLIIFLLFWAFYRVVEPLSFLTGKVERVFSSALVTWLVKAVRVLIGFLGLATILEVWGIEIGPILAGLGLVGVAVALGAQDLFKNLIAGILILMERRFSIGDWVKVDGIVEGTVESIGFRSTLIRRFDMAPVYVPNAQLSDNAVTNFSGMTSRRIFMTIGLEYRTTIDQLRQVRDSLEQYVLDNPDFESPSKVSTFVRVDRFSDSSIDIMLYCFTKTTNWGEWLRVKEELSYRIKDIVEGAGTSFAFPSRSLYLETVPEGGKEADTPRLAAETPGTEKPEPYTPPKRDNRTKAGRRGPGDSDEALGNTDDDGEAE